ncbi:MAG: aldehyde dehydrogenase family protein [Candidatus Omnitrophota bacterium]
MMSDFPAGMFSLFINGRLRPAENNAYFESTDPSTGEVFAQVADGSVADMRQAISAARKAFEVGPWPRFSVRERGVYLSKIAGLIRENAKILADLECADTGKTIKHTTFIDVPTVADTFDYFGQATLSLEPESLSLSAPVQSNIEHEPVGVVGCLIPWNYPLIMFGWKVAPALMAGNAVILKPSQLASVSILKLAAIIERAGLPEGVLNIVATAQHQAGKELIESRAVDKISFTGGTTFGQDVMRMASANTKKLTLELGGKSPNIVFADCDFEAALGGTMSAIFMNQGQMCTAGSRLLLEEKIYDHFLNCLLEKTRKLKIGPAMSYETDFGPLISRGHRDQVLKFIGIGEKEGAHLAVGGKIPDIRGREKGFYLEPAIFTGVDNQMSIAQEEIFGPVLSVIKFSDSEEAVSIANDSRYGLAACVWTKDLDKANSVARRLRCGTVWVNTYGGFYNEAPFGGYKQSGFGRELGREGLLEYTQTKHICTDRTSGGQPLVSSWF